MAFVNDQDLVETFAANRTDDAALPIRSARRDRGAVINSEIPIVSTHSAKSEKVRSGRLIMYLVTVAGGSPRVVTRSRGLAMNVSAPSCVCRTLTV